MGHNWLMVYIDGARFIELWNIKSNILIKIQQKYNFSQIGFCSLPYNLGSPQLVHPGTCRLTFTSISRFTDLIKFTPSLHDLVSFSITMKQTSITIFGPNIDQGGYMSVRHVSCDLDFIFMIYCFLFNLRQVFLIKAHFSSAIQTKFTIFGPCIVDGGYVCICKYALI